MNNMKILLQGALGKKVPADFALNDYDYKAALLDEMKKIAGDLKSFRRNKYDIYDLIAEEIDEELPQKVEASLGLFAEIRQFGNNDQPVFHVRRGVQRGKQFVTAATESGVYETFRLDHESFTIRPVAIGGGAYVDFERYLDGLEDMAELMAILMEGMVDRIWGMIQECLLNSWNMAGRPAANKKIVNGFDSQAMQKLCNAIRPYGSPVIYCSPEFASEMTNQITYAVAPNGTPGTWTHISEQDLQEIRERGYIGKFYGTPIVVLPQSYQDETNTKVTMDPAFAYVIPAGKEKLIKLGYVGETMYHDETGHENTYKMNFYRKMGVCMVGTPNYWGIYYNTALGSSVVGDETDVGWNEFHQKMGL